MTTPNKPTDPVEVFTAAGKAYSRALDAYRDSRDDATLDAAKAAMKAAERALIDSRKAQTSTAAPTPKP
jgi:hypothetical protein